MPIFANFKTRALSLATAGSLLVLAGCQGGLDGLGANGKAEVPIPTKLIHKMKAHGMRPTSPIMIRIFKSENVLEIWKQKDTGRYALLDSHEICKWSGRFGPKFKEGDRQAPEGFYTVNKHQLNPNSKYHLSFNMGFPNAYDRSHGRTGSHLMIHGACSSAGCYSMTDDRVEVIYALAREALRGGQKKFQIQAFPFRMTAENLFQYRNDKHYDFWKMLKRGYDHFEITRVPPKVNVCDRHYVFNTTSSQKYPTSGACPVMAMPQSLAVAFTKRQSKDLQLFEDLLAKDEGRKAQELQPLSFQQSLPGISVIAPPKPEPAPAPAPALVEQPKPTQIQPVAAAPKAQPEKLDASSTVTAAQTANAETGSATEPTANPATNPTVVQAGTATDPFAAEADALKKKTVQPES